MTSAADHSSGPSLAVVKPTTEAPQEDVVSSTIDDGVAAGDSISQVSASIASTSTRLRRLGDLQAKEDQAKLDAFEIDIIKNSKNRKLKSRIRKAKTLIEVTAFASALITLEHEKK